MRKLAFLIPVVALAGVALADDKPSEADIAAINATMAEMNCQVDSDEIEKTDDGFELDDVFCQDGQYDMEMNAAYEIVGKRKE